MNNTVVEPAVGFPGHTYAEPLAGLRVSWGSILAGAVAALAVSLILWSLALAIILSVAHTSALRGTLIAMGVTSIVVTLIGALAGGFLAGYLPGNPSRLIAGVHAFLAWGLAFLVASVMQVSMISGATRATTEAAVSTLGAAAQTAGATVGGAAGASVPLDQNAHNLLKSLGYSDSEATQMVNKSKAHVQQILRGRGINGESPVSNVDAAMNNVLHFMGGLSWAWFGTWFVSALLAIAGGLMGARRLTVPPARALKAEEAPKVPPISRTTPEPA